MAASLKVGGLNVDQALSTFLSGVNEAFPSGSSLAIDGVNYDKGALVQKLQQVIAPFKAVDDLHTQLANALLARTSSEPAAQDFTEKLTVALKYLFASDPNLLTKLGVPQAKRRRVLSSEEQVARLAKAKETRKLRATKGARQKEELKAAGTPVVSVSMPGGDAAQSTASAPSSTSGANGSTAPAVANGAAAQDQNGAAH